MRKYNKATLEGIELPEPVNVPRLAGFVSIYGLKASALLAYENQYEPEDAPRMI